MGKTRLEAFSDGVLAIVITIMVLELKKPHGVDIHALESLVPSLLDYLLSFIYVGIYWNNHHHLFHSTTVVSAGVLWANLHLLFWLSLFPFATGWMGENHAAPLPTAAYGVVLLMAGVAYYILQNVIKSSQGKNSLLAMALGTDWKGRLSPVVYLVGIPIAFVQPWISNALYAAVAMWWLVPDKRIERVLQEHQHNA
ncbi:MAG: TMEM175 family protein [Bryobacteraceae bacterium]